MADSLWPCGVDADQSIAWHAHAGTRATTPVVKCYICDHAHSKIAAQMLGNQVMLHARALHRLHEVLATLAP